METNKLEQDCNRLQFWDLKTCKPNSFVVCNFLKNVSETLFVSHKVVILSFASNFSISIANKDA